ncbi:MAG: M23 family metallopeptidase [Campylobacterota bacterium]|nr:M23 family metallopeptidase [Campylobacterota bacterium]
MITLIVVVVGFFLISSLSSSVDKLSVKSKALTEQNIIYTEQMKLKVQSIKELGEQLEEIETIIGIDKDDTTTLIQRATLAKLTSAQKIYMLQTIPSGCPLNECKTTSRFGWRKHPITQKRKYHKGLDLKAKRATDVFTTADGVVRYAQKKNDGAFGRLIIISHNFGFETVYAHLRKVKVKVGDVVKKGDLIALSGNSGRSNGPHLHYEVRYASKVLNPNHYIGWSMQNYNSLFEKQRRVEWESLVKLIKNQNLVMAQQ